jgi:hypothetical protein
MEEFLNKKVKWYAKQIPIIKEIIKYHLYDNDFDFSKLDIEEIRDLATEIRQLLRCLDQIDNIKCLIGQYKEE